MNPDELQAELYWQFESFNELATSRNTDEAVNGIIDEITSDPDLTQVVHEQLSLIEPDYTQDRLAEKINEHFNELISQWDECREALDNAWYCQAEGPTARRHALRALDDAIISILPSISTADHAIVPGNLDHHYTDGDRTLSLMCDARCIGLSSVSFGLRKYYHRPDCRNVKEGLDAARHEKYKAAVAAATGRFIITQVQGIAGTADERTHIKFRRVLLDAWKTVGERTPGGIDLFLPGELVYWGLPAVQAARLAKDERATLATPESLRINYDYLAPRMGFVYNPASALFERKIKD